MDEPSNSSQTDGNSQEDTLTMVDVLKTEQDLLEDANAVLGGSDDKNCTYSMGYLKRQALYACLTCIPEAKSDPLKRAGICLACCYQCHDGHELVELYTKRGFRCDCGNRKFPHRLCNLDGIKSDFNELNQYNQNFSGLYCICCRPYPDPEDTVNDEMIQCVICEDWFHCRHLGENLNLTNSYGEMTCKVCMEMHPFLYNYENLSISMKLPSDAEIATVSGVNIVEAIAHETDVLIKKEQSAVDMQSNAKHPDCIMPIVEFENRCTKFWQENWRQSLCKCDSCLKMYKENKLSFLIDVEDTVQYYEEKGKAKALENSEQSGYDEAMKMLNSIDRVQMIEAIDGYNDMRSNLIQYLKKFAENKKVVREEDIKEFFQELGAKKKQRVNMPYFCR